MSIKVEVFTTARCPYCGWAKRLLDKKGVAYEEIRVDLDRAKLEELTARVKRTSVPQIFIGDRHIGGYDNMVELDQDGELDKLLNGGAGGGTEGDAGNSP